MGELGAGVGLRVSWRTHTHNRVEVWYGEALQHVSVASDGLRDSEYVDVEVSYTDQGLFVSHAGVVRAQNLVIDGWAPQMGWRFAIGARTGTDSDDHHVADVLLEAGAVFHDTAVPVEVTFNGQDFSSSGLQYTYLSTAKQ